VRLAAGGATLLLATAALLTYGYRYSRPSKAPLADGIPGPGLRVPPAGAEDLYLQGRYYWNLRTADSLTKAIDDYTEAIVKDPSYAEAYAGLAESYDLLPQFAQVNPAVAFVRAEAAADRAIQLKPDLAAAHRAKAFALFFWNWDISGSDAEFRRALALDPNSAETHHWYASTLLNRLEGAECLKQIDEALRLSPSSAAIATDAALMHEEFGPDSEASRKRLLDIEQTQPTLLTPSYFLASIDFARGDYPGYIEQLHRTASISRQPDDIALADAATRGWEQDGRTGLLKEIVEVQKKAFKRGTESGYRIGQTYLLLGRSREALPYFKASFNQHYILLITMEQCAWSRKLSDDAEYAALFAQIREQMHGGGPAHPSTLPDSLDLPQ
jgi:tetratricopeptide (TPR) repeat protein